ncbi:type II toxin-antitoxin system VapC family toxin [Sulfuricystis multivorans]|uniref:type II toxin-antitoxin system VapC family toxin n=1 Tax=Sulfuricystis multivorans TaxID=2211108 RepID=UPI000F83CBAD|nr:type II toxin-antitoxin system VapC family toxin [Sulfuricystis multivorans]
MKLLLDTHAFLHWVADDPRLTPKVREVIADMDNEVFVSLIVPWELAIKSALGKICLNQSVGRFVTQQVEANGFSLLGIDLADIALVETLPLHHRDPFDRLLIAQAKNRNLTLVSGDAAFSAYSIKRIW